MSHLASIVIFIFLVLVGSVNGEGCAFFESVSVSKHSVKTSRPPHVLCFSLLCQVLWS